MFRRLSFAVLLVVLLPVPRVLAQDAAESYEEGRARFEAGDPAGAARAFHAAIAKEPVERAEILISGTNYIRPYVPHLYLGLTLLTSDPARAREELLTSRRQGVSARSPVLKRRLEAALEKLEAARTPGPPPMATPRPPIAPPPLAPPTPAPGIAPTATEPPVPIPRAVPPTPTPVRVALATRPPVFTVAPASPTPEKRETLRKGVREFLLGRYRDAIQTLERPSREGDETARLFMAFSLCGAYLAGGEKEPLLMAAAIDRYRSVAEPRRKDLHAGVSPRIRSVLERAMTLP